MPEEKPKMNYRILITRKAPNPNYAKEMEEFERNRGRFYDQKDPHMPQELITVDALVSELNDVQFEVLRKEVIKVF